MEINFIGEYGFSILFSIIGIVMIGLIIYAVKDIKGKNNNSLLFKDFNVGQFGVIMFRKIGERFFEIDRKKIKVTEEKWRYKNKDFKTFDMNKPAFCTKKKNYYAFDYDSGAQLTFFEKGMPKNISTDDVDVYVNRHIISDLVKGLEELKPKGQYVLLVVGIVLGIAIGIIIGMYAIPKPTVEIIAPTPTPIATPLLSILGGN